jgi:hypothetical protein
MVGLKLKWELLQSLANQFMWLPIPFLAITTAIRFSQTNRAPTCAFFDTTKSCTCGHCNYIKSTLTLVSSSLILQFLGDFFYWCLMGWWETRRRKNFIQLKSYKDVYVVFLLKNFQRFIETQFLSTGARGLSDLSLKI